MVTIGAVASTREPRQRKRGRLWRAVQHTQGLRSGWGGIYSSAACCLNLENNYLPSSIGTKHRSYFQSSRFRCLSALFRHCNILQTFKTAVVVYYCPLLHYLPRGRGWRRHFATEGVLVIRPSNRTTRGILGLRPGRPVRSSTNVSGLRCPWMCRDYGAPGYTVWCLFHFGRPTAGVLQYARKNTYTRTHTHTHRHLLVYIFESSMDSKGGQTLPAPPNRADRA